MEVGNSRLAGIVGKNIVRMLRRKDWTQKELARRLGYTEPCVSRWCSGHRLPGAPVLWELRDALGCTWEELMGE